MRHVFLLSESMNIIKKFVAYVGIFAITNAWAFDHFEKSNIESIAKECTISADGKVCKFDTTQSKIKAYRPMLTLKRGFFKPDTRYILKMKVRAYDAEDKAMLHFLIRNTTDTFQDGTDILKRNTLPSNVEDVATVKFKTSPNAEKYAVVITAFKKLKCEISDFSIEEDLSLKTISITPDNTKFELPKDKLPTGAKEFSVDQPNNPNGEIVDAKKFGILPNTNVSLKSISKALSYCQKVGAQKLLFEKNATYNIFENGHILIGSMKDFTFDGNGSTFVFRKKSGVNFFVSKNERTKICNLKIDWDWQTDPLASLAKIINVNKQKEYIDFELVHYKQHPAYPNYLRFAMCSPWDIAEKSVGLESEVNFIYDMHKGRLPEPKFEWLSPNVIRIFGKQANQKTAKVGMYLRVQHYYYDMTNMQMVANKHITLSNIELLSCASHGFTISGEQKYTLLDKVKIVPPQNDEKRIITTTADHMHVVNSQGYIKLVDCDFSYGADDCINFHDVSAYGTKIAPNTLKTTRSVVGQVGDEFEFRNDDYSPMNFSAKLKERKTIGKNTFVAVFDRDIPTSKTGDYVIFNRKFDTHNIIVRNCYFHHNRARGILVLARDVTIENCKFKRNEMGAIKLETGYTNNSWCEGYGVNNVVVRNCCFDDCNPRGNENWGFEREIFMGAYLKTDPSSEQTTYPVIKNVLFENNTFKNNYGTVATIGSAENVIFANNKFINTKTRKNPRAYRNGFFITHSKNILIAGNQFEKSQFVQDVKLFYDSDSTSNIKIVGNSVSEKDCNN